VPGVPTDFHPDEWHSDGRSAVAWEVGSGKWVDYAKCVLESKSIRASAKECGLPIPTAFLWRHRFLELKGNRKPITMQGIVEIDDTLFLNSIKGD